MIYFPVLEFGWPPASGTIKKLEGTSRKHSHWTQDPLNSAGSVIRPPRRSMNKLLILPHHLNHSHPMSSRCSYKHTLLCVCVRDVFFIPVNHSAAELSCCCWQMSVWMMCAGVSGCWSALLTNQSDWNQQGRLELYGGVVVQKVSLNVLSRRFEQHVLKTDPTSRSIATQTTVAWTTLKRSSSRRTGSSPYSWCLSCVWHVVFRRTSWFRLN